MMEMVWDEEMEEIAQRWTDQCDFGHDGNRRLLDGTYCGQNAASGYGSMNSTVRVSRPRNTRNVRNARITRNTFHPPPPCQAWYSEVENMDADCIPSDSKNCDVDKFG